MDKLDDYIKRDLIIAFSSDEECLEYFNIYDYQNFKSVDEMKEYQGIYGFNVGKKRYYINYDKALDIYDDEEFQKLLGGTYGK